MARSEGSLCSTESKVLAEELQTLTEKNLEELFGLKFVATEFQVDNLRIDTLAFNEETKSFVIIEYSIKHTD